MMDLELAAFLDRRHPVAESTAVWLGEAIRLTIRSYLGSEPPPLAYIGAARSVVLRGDDVLTLRNADETHVLPGGRREHGETPEQALRRELLEEAGLRIENPVQLGFMHLHHLAPKPPDYEFLYPDFLSLVYLSEAGSLARDARSIDDYEEEAIFRPAAEVNESGLSVESRTFLAAALESRRHWGRT